MVDRPRGPSHNCEENRAIDQEGSMPHITAVPYEEMSQRMQELAHMSDDALGGSDWVRVFAHAPKYYEA